MYRGPASRGRSKATPSTVCQKCLKRDIYECTVSAQERPYKPRPSRTQQLLNPNLKPKLTTEMPNELLRTKGVANELLAKKEEERGRQRSRNRARSSRDRSISTSSSDSVSTISTNRSRSRSQSAPPSQEQPRHRAMRREREDGKAGKRERDRSESPYPIDSRSADRNVRRRLSSFSPPRRGRSGRSASSGYGRRQSSDPHEVSRSRSRSRSRDRRRRRSHSRSKERRGRSRSHSQSHDRMETSQPHISMRYSRSPERATGPSDRSPSPFSRRKARRLRSPSPVWERTARTACDGPERTWLNERPQQQIPTPAPPPAPAPAPPRERSLSPYSRRVALTRQMQNH